MQHSCYQIRQPYLAEWPNKQRTKHNSWAERAVDYTQWSSHFRHVDWRLQKKSLSLSHHTPHQWQVGASRTSAFYFLAITQALWRYNIKNFFSKLVCVTDRGSNIVVALRTVTRLNCAAHVINTVLCSTICKPSEEDAFGEEVSVLVTGLESLVTYFKQTNLKARLKKTLKASVEMHWNSIHTVLESISCQYKDVCALLSERGEEGHLNDWDEETLDATVKFLQRFKEATKALEAFKTSTLHLRAVWYDRLKRHLQPSSTDNLTFSSLKA